MIRERNDGRVQSERMRRDDDNDQTAPGEARHGPGFDAVGGIEQGLPQSGRGRPPRQHTIRWWSERYDLPISTIYKAIDRGYLKALRPRGGSFIILPEAFWAWYGQEAGTSSPPPARTRPTPSAAAGPPRFQHVRWSELPDEPPDAKPCS